MRTREGATDTQVDGVMDVVRGGIEFSNMNMTLAALCLLAACDQVGVLCASGLKRIRGFYLMTTEVTKQIMTRELK